MNGWLLFCFWLFPLWGDAPPPWPRNRATGQIEVRGVLPWPASDTLSPVERVRHWYQTKLTEETPATLDSLRHTPPYVLTYGGVPAKLHFSFPQPHWAAHLGADVQLTV